MKFSKYMDSWLKSYYSNHAKIGKNGDFYTSVSVGALFGKLFALKIAMQLKEQNDTTLEVVEIGANEGHMLCDMALFLKEFLNEDDFKKLSFNILEPHEKLIQIQKQNFEKIGIKLNHKDEFENAIFICNELFDAMSVELYDNKKMAYVDNDKIIFNAADETTIKLAEEMNVVKGEIMTGVWEFLQTIKAKKFTFCGFDYGKDYERGDFSIRIFKNHEIKDVLKDDLKSLYGVSDITYNVSFNQLFYMINKLGFYKKDFKRQGVALVDFLTGSKILQSNKEYLLTQESNFYQKLKHLTYMLDEFYYFEFANFKQ